MDAQHARKHAHEIIIVGAGPTGLALAAELALARCDVAVIERRTDQRVEGLRAGGLHSRTIELLDQRGIAERFLSQGQRAQLAGFARVALDASDLRTRHNYGLVLGQEQIEQLLFEWASELPRIPDPLARHEWMRTASTMTSRGSEEQGRALGVRFYRGVSMTDFEQSHESVDVVLSDGERLAAQLLVGCDGGRSLVRKRAGIDFVGTDAQTSYVLAEVTFRDEPAWGLRYGAAGVHAIAKLPEKGRARVVLSEPFRGQPREVTLDELRALLITVFATDFGLESASWLSRFSDATRQATRYREGRVLLAGDAAHVHSPVGGQGLNTGVHDAFNLGWKLAQVVRGQSPESLLDSYHRERHPVAAQVLRTTLAQTALDRDDPRCAAMRESLAELLRMDEPRRRYAAMMAGLDVRYDFGAEHPLVGRRAPDFELRVDGALVSLYSLMHQGHGVLLDLGCDCESSARAYRERVRYVRAEYDGRWELANGTAVAASRAVLVRPDGHVAWVGDEASDELEASLRRWFGGT
ncbi:MAG: FAD-dependent monooxygenase [Polyangiales bacterium]